VWNNVLPISRRWKEIYSEDFTGGEKENITSALKKALELAGSSRGAACHIGIASEGAFGRQAVDGQHS